MAYKQVISQLLKTTILNWVPLLVLTMYETRNKMTDCKQPHALKYPIIPVYRLYTNNTCTNTSLQNCWKNMYKKYQFTVLSTNSTHLYFMFNEAYVLDERTKVLSIQKYPSIKKRKISNTTQYDKAIFCNVSWVYSDLKIYLVI